MKTKRISILSALWLALAFALVPVLRAQEPPPAPAAPAATAEKAAPAPTAEQPAVAAEEKPAAPPEAPAALEAPATPAGQPAVATEEKPAATVAPAPVEEEKADSELRELGKEDDKPAAQNEKKKGGRRAHNVSIHPGGDKPPFGNHTVSAESTQNEAVSVFGSTTVDGHVTDAAVSVFGDTTVNGTVDDAAVSVFGTTTVNGKVKGEAVAVFGDVVLGPDAEVDGQVVAVLGKLVRSPGSQIHGGTQEIGSIGPFGNVTGLRTWFTKCLFYGRPLAFEGDLWWAWCVALSFLAFYALIALITPSGVNKCVETLEQRPGYSLLSALLTLLLTPVAYILLVLTLAIAIGFVLIPLFSMGLFFAAVFGKIVMLAWLGRRFTKLLGDSPLAHPVFGVLIGGAIVLGLYTIPIIGFITYKLLGVLGLGVVVYTLILQLKASRPPKPVAVAASVAPIAAVAPVATPTAGEAVPPLVTPALVPTLPPVISASTLPRAGFWIRILASLLDAAMVGIAFGMMHSIWHGFGGIYPFWFAVYCVIMWATKGTTIGGIICGLKLVRVDDRPVDWSVSIVRCLSASLSLVVLGLGFIWVVFDDDKQSWHDKIAGTTIVKVPKGTPLL